LLRTFRRSSADDDNSLVKRKFGHNLAQEDAPALHWLDEGEMQVRPRQRQRDTGQASSRPDIGHALLGE